MTSHTTSLRVLAGAVLTLTLVGCSKSKKVTLSEDPSPSASIEWPGIPKSSAEVEKVINRSGREPYSGASGTVLGRVTIKGDPPPSVDWTYATGCGVSAVETYGKAFRVNAEGGLADVLVSVTDYDAYVPPSSAVVPVKASGCTFGRKTIVATYGQRIEVLNTDATGSYTPTLDGATYHAIMLAMPNGSPVKLYPNRPGKFVLRDMQGRDFMQADVFVLAYSTTDVTNTDGRFTIKNVPIGKVKVHAYLRDLDKVVDKEIDVVEGDNTVDFEMTFDAKTDKVIPRPPSAWERGTDPNRPARKPGEFGGPPPPEDSSVPR
ncbi:MAG: hypothetical protein U0271_32540 [Polyangiaceae bacterium]